MSYGGAPSTERMPGDLKKRFPGIILNVSFLFPRGNGKVLTVI